MHTETQLKLAEHALTLHRYPVREREPLRAWDAADEYLLSHVIDNESQRAPRHILVFNDAYGALTLGLHYLSALDDAALTIVSDSVIAHAALTQNANRNGVDANRFTLTTSAEFSATASPTRYDLLLIKIPKSLGQLEGNLRAARSRLDADARVMGAGMVKHVHNSTLTLFESTVGNTKTSLARKKARLIFSTPQTDTANVTANAVTQFVIPTDISKTPEPVTLASFPGVFCHGSLDFGTQFLLEKMRIPQRADRTKPLSILDLGCGTGALGLVAARRLARSSSQTPVTVTFVDESFAAIASVEESLRLAPADAANHHYLTRAGHCLEGVADQSVDLVLNNPPFHAGGAKTSGVALEMFAEAKRVLKTGGQIQVVGNRHLGYHKRLRNIFGNCETVATNDKFAVLRAVRG